MSLKSFCPSVCNSGFSGDYRCSILLGKGFGPKAYQQLFHKWTDISKKEAFELSQADLAKQLLRSMFQCKNDTGTNEGVLSGVIVRKFLALLPIFSDDRT